MTYQEHVTEKVKDKCAQLEQYYEQIVSQTQSEIACILQKLIVSQIQPKKVCILNNMIVLQTPSEEACPLKK